MEYLVCPHILPHVRPFYPTLWQKHGVFGPSAHFTSLYKQKHGVFGLSAHFTPLYAQKHGVFGPSAHFTPLYKQNHGVYGPSAHFTPCPPILPRFMHKNMGYLVRPSAHFTPLYKQKHGVFGPSAHFTPHYAQKHYSLSPKGKNLFIGLTLLVSFFQFHMVQ